jgi:hypothetical protein
VVQPIAVASTRGTWWRRGGWCSTLDAVDDPDNGLHSAVPQTGRGPTAYPQIRFVLLSKNATPPATAEQSPEGSGARQIRLPISPAEIIPKHVE